MYPRCCPQATVLETMAELRRFDEGFDSALGVAAIDLTDGRTFGLHRDTVFPQASVIKIAILARMYQAARAGKFTLDERVTIETGEAVGGSGPITAAVEERRGQPDRARVDRRHDRVERQHGHQ